MNTYPFVIIISILLIIMWAYAAISKLLELKAFKQALATQVFPVWIGKILVWVLPVVELAIVGLLLFQKTQILGMYASFGMMLLFTLYVGGAVFNIYERYPCACGGLFAKLGWKKHFRVNIFFTLISIIGIVLLESGR
ncbi:MauE/DoxX family redox-associated membrane protein [Pedobacter caeni]|uniref:Methylamine utilisation protein MauE n=1 Tax=Pedobacter caeni TaxID=288992 RepID=A0A1M5H4Q4_9SPHI|nr:MauE/DoxX family redox-associated membrane protein [Pedobacter caeni]SHG10970.1 Methylamine utilisation protein MauE [Pedobacter caeni]